MRASKSWAPAVALLLVAAVANVATVASVAEAQTSDSDRAAARGLAQQGVALKKEGKLTEALDVLQRAQALYFAPTHLLLIAQCQVGLGQLVEASETYRRLARAALDPKGPAAFKQAQATGEREAAELEPRIAALVVTIDPPGVDGVQITLDGVLLSGSLIGAARPTNPGEHRLDAKAPGFEPAKESLRLAAGEKRAVTLTLKKVEVPLAPPPPVPSATAPASSASVPEPPPPPAPRPGETGSSRRTLAWVAGGVGAASIAVGAYFGARTLSNKKSRDADCNGTFCGTNGLGHQDDAFSTARLSNIFFGVGLVGLGAATVLFLTAPGGDTTVGVGPSAVRITRTW